MFYNELLLLNHFTIHLRFASNFALVKISELLEAKGMNPEVAMIRAQEVFGTESAKASLYLHNIQYAFDVKMMPKIYDYIASRALFQDKISFSSNDQMLRMMQEVYSLSLNEKELNDIRKISKANEYAILL